MHGGSTTSQAPACFRLQFGRLERVEVGGSKGKALTNAIKQVHADFLLAHGKFQEVRAASLCAVNRLLAQCGCATAVSWGRSVAAPVPGLVTVMHVLGLRSQVGYDVMDVDAPNFHSDFSTFKAVIKELEHRLGALIMQVRRWLAHGRIEAQLWVPTTRTYMGHPAASSRKPPCALCT